MRACRGTPWASRNDGRPASRARRTRSTTRRPSAWSTARSTSSPRGTGNCSLPSGLVSPCRATASVCRMSDLGGELDALASRTGFSGVVRIDQDDQTELARAYGLAHRGFEIPNAVDTRFGLASGAKGFTALAVVRLIEEGVLELSTPARSVLGGDLPMIDDGVTVEHLLSHRSGIGDYLDEEAGFEVEEYVMPVPVRQLATTEDYLAALDGRSEEHTSELQSPVQLVCRL